MPANAYLPQASEPTSTSHDASSTPRDPHLLPQLGVTTLKNATDPILYLPPLLSSLPTCKHDPARPCHNGFPQSPIHTQTHLPDIDPVSLSLHRALHHFRPLDRQYSTRPYAEAFNWDELSLPEGEEREWYCVAFRSKRKRGSNGDALYSADAKAHEEAVRNGGLIMYWYGVPDPVTGVNLATCIWQSRRHAIAASSKSAHGQAMRLAAVSYEMYDLERHILTKKAGERGLTVQAYVGGDVGW